MRICSQGWVKLVAVLLAVGSVLELTSSRAEDWPQFRGVNSSGVSTHSKLPVEFSAHDKVRWQANLSEGIASPVIVQGRVFSTSMTAPTTFTVWAHQASDGKELWKRDFETGPLPRITPPNSHASSTPAADAERVYVYFSTLGLIALQAESGKIAWKFPLPKPAYLMDWGAASSPIVYQDKLLFCLDDDLTPYLLAVDKNTGKTLWKTSRPEMLAGYAVPVLCQAQGRTDVVVAGSGRLQGYDPETGQEIWTCNTLVRTIMTTPVVRDDTIYIAVQSYGDSTRTLKFALLEWLDTNQDKSLSRSEVPQEFLSRFDESDKNGDKVLADDELDTAFQSRSNQVGGGNIIQAIRGGGTGDITRTGLVWNVTKPLPSNLTSPLVTDERLYVVKAGGISACLNRKDGELQFRERIGNFGDHYASPVAAAGKIYIAGRNGFVMVLEDSSELKVLAKNDMEGEIVATPAIADHRLYIRTRDTLYCIGE